MRECSARSMCSVLATESGVEKQQKRRLGLKGKRKAGEAHGSQCNNIGFYSEMGSHYGCLSRGMVP